MRQWRVLYGPNSGVAADTWRGKPMPPCASMHARRYSSGRYGVLSPSRLARGGHTGGMMSAEQRCWPLEGDERHLLNRRVSRRRARDDASGTPRPSPADPATEKLMREKQTERVRPLRRNRTALRAGSQEMNLVREAHQRTHHDPSAFAPQRARTSHAATTRCRSHMGDHHTHTGAGG